MQTDPVSTVSVQPRTVAWRTIGGGLKDFSGESLVWLICWRARCSRSLVNCVSRGYLLPTRKSHKSSVYSRKAENIRLLYCLNCFQINARSLLSQRLPVFFEGGLGFKREKLIFVSLLKRALSTPICSEYAFPHSKTTPLVFTPAFDKRLLSPPSNRTLAS